MGEGAAPLAVMRRPEGIFAVMALAFGLFCAAFVPPVGGGNEGFNFPRAMTVAFGQFLVGPCAMPAGLLQFTDAAAEPFHEGVQPPFGYSFARLKALAAIPLRAETPAVLPPNPISVLNPVAYLPQAAAIRAGALLGLRPIVLFYLARLTGLVCSVLLTALALRALPTHRYTMAAVMLLPPAAFMRGMVDADQITVAVEFLFIALTLGHVVRAGKLTGRELSVLAAVAFIAAQCKMAYLLLPLLCLAIPRERFRSGAHRAVWLALLILPGAGCSLAYLVVVKLTYFAHIQYSTYAGAADPSAQLKLILAHPAVFPSVLLRTVFTTPIVLQSLREVLGVFGPPVSLNPVSLAFQAMLLGMMVIADLSGRLAPYPRGVGPLCGAVFVVSTAFILGLLYLQWNGVGAATIQGFQGRYVLPLLPLLAVFVLPARSSLFPIRPVFLLVLTGSAGLLSAGALIVKTYYG